MSTTNRSASPASAVSLGAALEALLGELLAAQDRLHEVVVGQREAVRGADAAKAEALGAQHARMVRVLSELEQRRREVTARAVRELGLPAGGATATLSDLASRLPEPGRTRVMTLADRLKRKVEEVRAESATLRSAAKALAAHMEGLMRHVARHLGHAGTYSARGRMAASAAGASALDLRS